MLVELYAKSDIGQKRTNNEDNFLLLDLTARHYWTGTQGPEPPPALHHISSCQKGIVLVAADGMGGELAGEVASRMAVEVVCNVMASVPGDTAAPLGDHLRGAVIQASQAIQVKGQEPEYHKLGSTFTGAALKNGVLELVQVGDSRAYVLRGKEVRQVTKDQTLVQQLIDIGQISEADAERHPYKHVLIQALGLESSINPATGRVHLRRGDVLLLCSDGLSGKLGITDIQRIIQAHNGLAEACRALVAEANARGGEDNITVVLARCLGDDLPVPDGKRIMIERMSTQEYDETTTMGLQIDEVPPTLPSFPSDLSG